MSREFVLKRREVLLRHNRVIVERNIDRYWTEMSLRDRGILIEGVLTGKVANQPQYAEVEALRKRAIAVVGAEWVSTSRLAEILQVEGLVGGRRLRSVLEYLLRHQVVEMQKIGRWCYWRRSR